ncbi:LysR family transcriptional regulator [uncultured Roseobacter sp.]|uniref:LysR family transcriptional regulator n=1 Tax=uncultured Roseobacter sp. TaxID=114847 RepID=UPI0026248742|nr:LysR family transcriptional regulator [uncultured Roseobacter sp.]
MTNWDEIKTAYHVARRGTVSGAAEVLGVHHATVIRHVDALEARLGVKLFQRHARGYTATEAGQDLLRVAQATDDQFSQLAGRIRGQGDAVSGELVVTSLTNLVPRMAPVLTDFQRDYPEVVVRYLTGDRLFRLEYGEAHVAIRAGNAPDQPDNVVQNFHHQHVGLYATRGYLDVYGTPGGIDDFPAHRFVGHDTDHNRAPFNRWLRANVPGSAITFRATDTRALEAAVIAGAGIGFLPAMEAQANPDLVEVIARQDDWSVPLWLVSHVDLHRTTKVQTFLDYLKKRAARWDS